MGYLGSSLATRLAKVDLNFDTTAISSHLRHSPDRAGFIELLIDRLES